MAGRQNVAYNVEMHQTPSEGQFLETEGEGSNLPTSHGNTGVAMKPKRGVVKGYGTALRCSKHAKRQQSVKTWDLMCHVGGLHSRSHIIKT